MEFLGVALSLPIADCNLQSVSAKIYSKWIHNSAIFGSNQRQNKYLRRIITQLSLPFAFREPKNPEKFEKEFYPLLEFILDTLNQFHLKRGSYLEEKTWGILFNTLIGINDAIYEFHFDRLLTAEKVSHLKQKAVTILLSSIQCSGIKTDSLWNTLVKYCKKWSNSLDFLKVWGNNIRTLFQYMNGRIYNIPNFITENPLKAGIYNAESPVELKMLSFIFYKTNFAIDYQKTIESPSLLYQLASDCSILVDIALDVAEKTSTLLLNRFPAASFLKLFGPFISFPSVLGDQFDKAISRNIDSILRIVAHFDHSGAEESLQKMISYVINRVKCRHEFTLASFMNQAIQIFPAHLSSLPLISGISLAYLHNYSFPRIKEYITFNFNENVVSLMISSAEVSGQLPEEVFNSIWSNTQYLKIRFSLLCYAQKLEFQIIQKVVEVFQDQYVELACHEEGLDYLISLTCFISSYIRAHPEKSENITKIRVFPHIVNAIMKGSPNDRIIISVLIMILSIIEWGGSMFQKSDNISHFFKFTDWLKQHISKTTYKNWSDSNTITIQSLLSIVLARVNVHMPQNDYYTHILNSSNMINEESVIKSLNITGCEIYHYTIDNYLLISFLEKSDGSDPLAIFVRGAFGKSIWTVKDDYQGQSPEPRLSDEVPKVDLPRAEPPVVNPIALNGEKLNDISPAIDMSQLAAQDEALRKVHGDEFATWLDWDKYGFYTPFNEKATYQRPRVADFLTTLGLLENKNSMKIRIQNDTKKVQECIQKFDLLDNQQVIPIPIIHILAEDEALEYNDLHFSRTTVKIQQFLREIANPMIVSKEASNYHNLPFLRTPVPMIPSAICFCALLCPSMAEDVENARKVSSLISESPIVLIFNETDFDVSKDHLKIDRNSKLFSKEQIIIIIKPTLDGLYHVWQESCITNVIPPFRKEQTLDAYSLAFNISLLLEICSSSRKGTDPIPNIAQQRVDIISELCKSQIEPDLGPLITTQFSK